MTDAPDTQPADALIDEPQPTRINSLRFVAHTLLRYGRHLAETIVARAKNPNFATIAVCFGTADLSLITARIQRGILRAIALVHVLEDRAAMGRDVAWISPRRQPRHEPTSEPACPKPARTANPTPSRWDDLASPLTLDEMEDHICRRPIGRTILDICLDLAVMPALCERVFGSHLFDAMNGHRGSISKWMAEKQRRWNAFLRERDRGPVTVWWDWFDDTTERIRGVLGFQIGEPPTLPAPP